MLTRATAATIALTLAALTPALAQNKMRDYKNLERMLEDEDFAPAKKRALAPAPAAESAAPAAATASPAKQKQDFEWVKPKTEAAEKLQRAKQPNAKKKQTVLDPKKPDGKRSDATPAAKKDKAADASKDQSWFGSIFSYFSTNKAEPQTPAEPMKHEPSIELSPRLIAADAASVPMETLTVPAAATRSAGTSEESPAASASAPVVLAQAEVPIAKKNSFVIQLKPDTSKEQLSELLQKYDLTITNKFPRLGVITVEVNEPTTRGLGGSDDPGADPKKKLKEILEPQIIKDLRAEPVVGSAFVNSTVDTKRLPAPSGVRLEADGKIYSWRWTTGDDIDGNWGLKALRMPPVWSMLDRHRKLKPGEKRPKIGVVDGGFIDHKALRFSSIAGAKGVVAQEADCGTNHGMHVAGIIGASHGEGAGVNGMIPDARIDAIGVSGNITGDAGGLGIEKAWQLQTLLFDDVLIKTMKYLVANETNPDNLRVVNISLGYNFLALDLLSDEELESLGEVKRHIGSQATLIRDLAQSFEDDVLFVVAAGNDSDGRETPLDARWANPFAWAAKHEWLTGEPVRNIVVVEAADRDGKRASFSNTGGDVAAPGVDILSTLAGGKNAYAVCSGTSQAAPHVAALAAILFELAPEKTPAEIIGILKSSGRSREGATPEIDALEAALTLAPSNARLLADLDGDGTVGAVDMSIFSRQLKSIEAAASEKAEFKEDLNGDGVVDDNECYWPQIDFNGSGQGAASIRDARALAGEQRADLQAMAFAWSDPQRTFDVAASEAGIKAAAADTIYAVASERDFSCRRMAAVAEAGAGTGPAGGGPAAAGAVPLGEGAETRAAGGDGTGPLDETRVADATGSTPVSDDTEAVKKEVQDALAQLKRENPKAKITVDPSTGLVTSITGLTPAAQGAAPLGATRSASGEMTPDEVKRAVEGYFATGALRSAFTTKNKQATRAVTGTRRDPDFPDRYVADVEQRVGEVPVFGSSAKLTVERSLGVTKFTGTSSAVAIQDTSPAVSKEEAAKKGKSKLDEILSKSPDVSRVFPMKPNADKAEMKDPELIIFDPAVVSKRLKGPTRLAWLVTIESFRIFIDAKTGEVFHYYRDQPSGMVRRVYDLAQTGTFPGKKILDEETRERAEDLDADALTAFQYSGLVRDFFFLVFGRDSYDDDDGPGPNGGGVLEAYVRHGRTQDAYWCTAKSFDCPKGNVMVYGPGYAGSIDIVGHEMTHGIISHSKKLNYFDESGAVNESFADIFGSLIEFHARGAAGNWLIGEEAPGFSPTSPLRNMADPRLSDENGKPLFDRNAPFSLKNRGQPDTYAELLTPADKLCDSTAYDDNGCVHFNSGILNKFAYLIAEGGDHGGVTVTGLGRYKLARLAYRTITVNINKSSGLADAANGFGLSCLELAEGKVAGMTPADCDQVVLAQRAVGLEAPNS